MTHRQIERETRRLIVFDGEAWFVRRVVSITHDLDHDEKLYRCDQPIGGRYATLADVPEVAALLSAQDATIARLVKALSAEHATHVKISHAGQANVCGCGGLIEARRALLARA